MGLHDICNDEDHYFLKNEVEILYNKDTREYIFQGRCAVCNRWRIIKRKVDEIADIKYLHETPGIAAY